MSPNVLDHEPAEALFVPDKDPLLFYRHIAVLAEKVLHEDGRLYLEIHEDHGPHTLLLLKSHGFTNPEIKQDINGKDRMVRARRTRT
jgi:release factor glutamine methyltransferase